MTYFLIITVLIAAIAPLWHFKPTRRQKKQASLRETAALSGLYVELRDLPLEAEQLKRLPSSERQVLYYGRRLPGSGGKERQNQAWFRRAGEWESRPARLSPPPISTKLPESVVALAVSEASCGVFWTEDGDEETVRDIAALLTEWGDSLKGP